MRIGGAGLDDLSERDQPGSVTDDAGGPGLHLLGVEQRRFGESAQ
jgi:hypothetical protein